jgi:hypothetical protein
MNEKTEKILLGLLFVSLVVLINAIFEGDSFWLLISEMVSIPCLIILSIYKLRKI